MGNSKVSIIGNSVELITDRIEKKLPGSTKNRLKCNQAIKDITNEFLRYYVNISDIKNSDVPDGIHYSKEGHTYIAEKLASIIIDDQKVIS